MVQLNKSLYEVELPDGSIGLAQEYALMEKLYNQRQFDLMSSALQYPTPEQIANIQEILDSVRQANFVFKGTAQLEFDKWVRENGVNALTPQIEADFQSRIDAERAEYLAKMSGTDRPADVPTPSELVAPAVEAPIATVGESIEGLKGLGDASVKKLYAAGVDTVTKLRALPYEERCKILSPVVAMKLNYLV